MRVALETPYAGDVKRNIRYAKDCMLDCLRRNEAPFASHLLYTQVLDDLDPEQRSQGIAAGFLWNDRAQLRVFYVDLGMSPGMKLALERAQELGQPIDMRTLPSWAQDPK